MTVLVTGAAGFIGSAVARAFLDRGESVVGLDNLNSYYDPTLKQARLDRLTPRNGFAFVRADTSDRDAMDRLVAERPDIDRVVHLAAQAGVRHSLKDPYIYVTANVMSQVVMAEACRKLPAFRHLVYASTSSVYGANETLPFAVADRVDHPVSLYAATKKSCELIAQSYAAMYGLPQTGLRFFTVYGPWGRPDMALFMFTKAIIAGTPIPVFNGGDMSRDFTYVDDIVAGVVAAVDRPPLPQADAKRAPADIGGGSPWHRVYNLGNHRGEPLMRMIALIEKAVGRKAQIEFQPMQAGDVRATFADIEPSIRDLDYRPVTPIDVGIPRFVEWYREFYRA